MFEDAGFAIEGVGVSDTRVEHGHAHDSASAQQQSALRAEFMRSVETRDTSAASTATVVRTIFADPPAGAGDSDAVANSGVVNATPARQRPLSKLVEYPGDVAAITALLGEADVNAAGKDMFGLAAVHKFASWDKVLFLSPGLQCGGRE